MAKNPHDLTYATLVHKILIQGEKKMDRTGVGTRGLFGQTMTFDMDNGFPLLTLKYTPFKAVAHELLWFIEGGSGGRMNNEDLLDRGVSIWTPWAAGDGDLGPIYGAQWRSWPAPDGSSIDQLAGVETKLKENPDDRRLIVSAWNAAAISEMALPPCHLLFQFYSRVVNGVRHLDLQMYQRSCDMFIGVPFNIASYALLLHLMAAATGHKPGVFKWVGGDCHVYSNHLDKAKFMLSRLPYNCPALLVHGRDQPLGSYTIDDIQLMHYVSHKKIEADVAV